VFNDENALLYAVVPMANVLDFFNQLNESLVILPSYLNSPSGISAPLEGIKSYPFSTIILFD